MIKRGLILILYLAYLFARPTLGGDRLAITLKARGDTKLKRADEADFKPNLKIGTNLFNKDHLMTGRDGFIALVFIDDKSQIKVRENSELVISGDRKKYAISKQISMQFGTLKAEVSPQRKGDFVIATPTSVASVKGTVFWVLSDPIRGDTFYGISGTVAVTNNESGVTVVVGENQTCTSMPEGSIDVKQTEEGDVPKDIEEEIEINNILRIQLRNNQGEIKEIKVEYK